jgi:hypothetical protein
VTLRLAASMNVRRAGLAAALLALPGIASGQRLSLTPVIGSYRPLAEQLYRWEPIASSSGYLVDSQHVDLGPAVAFGLTLRALLGACCGVDMSVMTAGPDRRVDRGAPTVPLPPAPQPNDIQRSPVRTTLLALRLLAHPRLGARVDVMLGIGPTIVFLRGAAYDASTLARRTVLGWSAAATVGVTVRPGARLELAGADHIYRLDFGSPGAPPAILESGTQHDLVASAGLTLTLLR